jgi:hypothetical protein
MTTTPLNNILIYFLLYFTEKPPEKPAARSRTRQRKRKPADTCAKPVVTVVKKTAAPPISSGGSSSNKRAKSNDKSVSGNTLSEFSSTPVAAPVQGNVKPAAKPKEKRPKRHKSKSEKNENEDSCKAKLVKKDVKEAPPVEPLEVSETVVTVREETVLPSASVEQKEISEEIKTVIKPADIELSEEQDKPVVSCVSSVCLKSEKPKQQFLEVKEKSLNKKLEKERHRDKPEKERRKSDKEKHKEKPEKERHKDKPEKERHKDKPEKERHKKKKKEKSEKLEKEKFKRLSVKSDLDQSDEDKSCFEHDEETSRLINSIIESISRETRAESEEKQKQASRARTKSENSNKSEPVATTSDESGKFCDESAMHYKKQLLLGDFKEKPTQDISATINLNLSVTDQLAKFAKGKVEANSSNPCGSITEATPPPSLESVCVDRRLSQDLTLGECAPGHQTVFRSDHNTSHVRNDSFSDERSSSRLSSSSRMSDERRPNSRVDEIRRKGIGPSTSPLVFDKDKPVEPYRDPELMKKDSEVRHITSLQHAAMQRPHAQTPVSAASTYPTVHTPLAPHHSTLPAHHPGSLLTPLHFPQQHISSMASLNHPHVLTHATTQLDVASLVARGAIPQQQAHLIQYPAHLLQQPQAYSFTLHGNISLSQLEVLWQRKYPTIPVPPAWMLAQYQEELLRDVNLLRERELLERERIERERLERERERAER